MRIDGEPWKQPLPKDDETVMIEISHFGQVSILANRHCLSRSITAPHSTNSSSHDGYDSEGDDEEDLEERRKLGAANTFRLPDDFDIASLS